MLALACRFSDQLEGGDFIEVDTTGDRFFEEAKDLLASETDPSVLTVQALSLMSLREAGCGHDAIGYSYARQSIRMAVELGLHMNHIALEGEEISHEEREVRSVTFWGCFALDQ